MEEHIATSVKNLICIKFKNKVVKLEHQIVIYSIVIAVIASIFG